MNTHPQVPPLAKRCLLAAFVLSGIFVATALAAHPLQTQVPQAPAAADDKFDAVSIRPSKADNENSTFVNTADGLDATNVTISILLQHAFHLRPDQIAGLPGWSQSKRFDVKAKSLLQAEEGKRIPPDERARKLAAALRDRFALATHLENRQMPVYNLGIAARGSRIRLHGQSPPPDQSDFMIASGVVSNNGEIQVVDMPLSALTTALSEQLGRTVVDQTGLTGRYDLSLKWTPRDAEAGSDAADVPDIFTSVREQLGLELHAGRGSVQMLVIDHVSLPSAN